MVAKSNDIKSVQALRIVYIVFWLPNSLPCRPTDTEARIVKIKANGFIVFVPKYGSLPSNLLCGLNVMPFVVFTPFSNQVRHRRAHLPYSKGRQRWWLGSRRGAPESNQARNKHQLACSYFFVGKCDRNLATQSNIFRSHSDGISNFSVWGQDVVSISRNKIALTSLSRPASEVRLSSL